MREPAALRELGGWYSAVSNRTGDRAQGLISQRGSIDAGSDPDRALAGGVKLTMELEEQAQ